MSEKKILTFMEHESSQVNEHLRIARLSKAVREGFAALTLHQRYHLFTHKPFKNMVHPGYTDSDSIRRLPKVPEYPDRKSDEDAREFRLRVEKFRAINADYQQVAAEYTGECVEYVVEQVEKLNARGEHFDVPRTSTLQRYEGYFSRCDFPVFVALLVGRDWTSLLPPAIPLNPNGHQTKLF